MKTPLAAVAVLLGVLAACSTRSDVMADATTPGPGEYLPGHSVQVDRPEGDPSAVVVLVPGGGWLSADPSGLSPLAESLADAGLAVVTISYGTSAQGDYYPRPVDDVACAAAYAAEQVPGVPVVLVGHSAGAHLAVLAGLRPDRDDDQCPYRRHAADGVVGLAGPYDVARASGVAQNLFGTPQSEALQLWRDGNPHTWVAERPDLPVLLAHGENDRDVAVSFTSSLATALTEAGHEVAVEILADVDHASIYEPKVISDLIVEWIASNFPTAS